MPDAQSIDPIFAHALTFVGSSTGTIIIQYLLNRRKSNADIDSIMTKNMKDIDDFYQNILEKREGMAEKIYDKLISHETTILTLKDLNEKLHQEIVELKKKLATQKNGHSTE